MPRPTRASSADSSPTRRPLLGKALSRDDSTPPVLLPVVAEAFGHDDAEAQERALKLVGRHIGGVDADVRAELADAAALLGPALRKRAEGVFGTEVKAADAGPYEELLPPPPEPRRMAPAPVTLDELVGEVAVLADGNWTPRSAEQRERVLDGLVRHAFRDREGLTDAVRPKSLVSFGAVKANRCADALRSVAATGAYRTAWSVLRPLLAGVTAAEPGAAGCGRTPERGGRLRGAVRRRRCGDRAGRGVGGVDAAGAGSQAVAGALGGGVA